MKPKANKNFASMTITMIVIALLIISGPISAVRVGLGTAPSAVDEEEAVAFTTHVTFETDEVIPIEQIVVAINDSLAEDVTYTTSNVEALCVFDINGNALSGTCTGDTMNVSKVSNTYNTAQGYGYGYSSNRMGYDYTTVGSAGYGYQYTFGYGYGYGYDSVNMIGTINYTISWTTPTVTADTTYDVFTRIDTGSEGQTFDLLESSYIIVNNVVATGGDDGDSGSSSGSSSGAATTDATDDTEEVPETEDYTVDDTPVEITDTAEKTDLVNEFGDLGAGFEDASVEDIEITKTNTITITDKIDSTLNDIIAVIEDLLANIVTDDKAKSIIETLKQALSDGSSDKIEITKTVENYEIINTETGTTADRSKITIVITATDKNLKDIEIIEIISKLIAETTEEISFTTEPTILQTDPIVQWSFDEIKKGTTKDLSYIINKKVSLEDIQASQTLTSAAALAEQTETPDDTQTPDTTQDDTTDDTTTPIDTDNKDKSNAWLYILIALALIGGVVYYLISIGKIKMKN